MAAVIRIKRYLNEDPLDAVLLSCKRRKTDDSSSKNADDLSAILKFAATVDDPEDAYKHIKKPTKLETEEQFKKRTPDLLKKLREQNQASSKNSRFKIINSFRSSDSRQEPEADLDCTVVDIETNEKRDESDSTKTEFVYDLYYTNSDELGDADLNEFISVYPLSDSLIYDTQTVDRFNDIDSDNSEDSNAESNWRNDYPDESDVESVEERDDDSVTEVDMLRAMNKVALDDELSSDDYDVAFGYNHEGNDDDNDSYSRFKANVDRSMKNEFCHYDYDDSCTP